MDERDFPGSNVDERTSLGTNTDARTRRRFLTATVALCGTVAGCVGDDDDPDTDEDERFRESFVSGGGDEQAGEDEQDNGDGQADGDEQDTATGNGSELGDDLDRPALGDEDAPVTVTVCEDFSCPGCRMFKADVFPRIVEEYVDPGNVRYRHGDLPIPVDETWSWAIPSAAREIYERAGNDAFWAFSAEIFDHQNEYSYDVIETVAEDVAGLGTAARDAAENEPHRGTIEVDRERAIDMGASGTPTVFVGGEIVDPGFETVAEAIENRL